MGGGTIRMLAIIFVNFECRNVLNCNYHIWFFLLFAVCFRYYKFNNGSLYLSNLEKYWVEIVNPYEVKRRWRVMW